MLYYTLKDSTREEMAQEDRAVQIAISTIANQQFSNGHKPKGVGKYGGGVTVNGREILIYEKTVTDAGYRGTEETPEEKAVVQAIEQVANEVEKGGIGSIKHYFNETFYMSDRLRFMLGVSGPEEPSP